MPRKKVMTADNRESMFRLLGDPETADFVKSILALRTSTSMWRGVLATPPGSLVEEIVREFEMKTDIPLEIPFFVFFHLVAGLLLHTERRIVFEGKTIAGGDIRTDIWSVILAPSGAGKSYTLKVLREMAQSEMDEIEFEGTGIVSGAKFVADLADNNNKIFIRDEFNEFYKAIQDEKGPLKDLKDYLLRIYDNDNISRKTKESEIVVDNAALVILGLTVDSSFTSTITPDDIVNGFAQRFSYVIAPKDPKRKMIDYPIYAPDVTHWDEKWRDLVRSIVHKEYIATDDAVKGYITAFRSLIKKDIPDSFYRRVLWKAHKYALIYHIIRGYGHDQNLTVEDYGWAARILHMHLQDALTMLQNSEISDLEKCVTQAEKLIKKKEANGEPVTPRTLVQGVKNIKTVSEAKNILSLLQ